MTEKLQPQTKAQNIILQNRRTLSVSGVTEVDRFDEHIALIYTEMGELTINGSDLHVSEISVETGEMTIEGEIRTLAYGDKDRRGALGLLGKLFR